jgi:hypothetical protein
MTTDEKARLEAELEAAEAEVAAVRTDNTILAEDFRLDPDEQKRAALKLAAEKLGRARDRADAARAALEVLAKTGSPHGLVADRGRVTGTIAIAPRPGWSQKDRERAIDEALDEALVAAADELGVVLAAAPLKYTKERPGRDPEGRVVLEVAGRVEGDRLVPAVSRAAKQMKK